MSLECSHFNLWHLGPSQSLSSQSSEQIASTFWAASATQGGFFIIFFEGSCLNFSTSLTSKQKLIKDEKTSSAKKYCFTGFLQKEKWAKITKLCFYETSWTQRLKVLNVKFDFYVFVRHCLLSTHRSKSNSMLVTYLHAVIRTHHFDFVIRFWRIITLMSKTLHWSQIWCWVLSVICFHKGSVM